MPVFYPLLYWHAVLDTQILNTVLISLLSVAHCSIDVVTKMVIVVEVHSSMELISCSTYCSFWWTLYYLFGVLFRCSLLTSVLVSVPSVYMLIYLLIKVPELFNWIKKACSPMYRKRRRRSHVARSDRNLVTLVRNRLVTLRCMRRSFSLVVQACNSNWIHL